MSQGCPFSRGRALVGHLPEMKRAPHRFVAEIAERGTGVARFRVLRHVFTAVTRPELVQHVLGGQADNYVRSRIYARGRRILGNGLLFSEGEHWRRQRRLVQPAFHASRLPALGPVVARSLAPLADEWAAAAGAGRSVDVVPAMLRLALDVIAQMLFGHALEDARARVFAEGLRDSLRLMKEGAYQLLPLPLWWPLGFPRRVRAVRRQLDAYLAAQIERHRAEPEPHRDTLLFALLEARDPATGAAMPEHLLLDEVRNLFTAGWETTATALAWTLHLVAGHPDVERRLRDEVDAALGGATPAHADLERLRFVEQVVRESLRLYPPVYNLSREAVASDSLAACPVEPGQMTMVGVWGAHRSADHWDRPLDFDPERFAPERAAGIPRGAYLPFGLGRHTCLGSAFAMVEMTLALAGIAQRFRLEPDGDGDPGERAQITLVPERPIPVRFVPRHA